MYGEELPAIERMISDLLAEKRVARPDWMQIYLYGGELFQLAGGVFSSIWQRM
jgi:hypothetical protein